MNEQVLTQIIIILVFTVFLALAILLLSIYKRLFLNINNRWLRLNLVVQLIGILLMCAFLALQSPELLAATKSKGFVEIILKQLLYTVIIVLFVFNIVWVISRLKMVKSLTFIKYHVVIVSSIILSAVIIYAAVNFVENGMRFKNLHSTLSFSYFNAVVTGLIYTAINYVELERKRKLSEKELEVTQLMALKTKAELDALHSKVNPHFLYNALNSIADLSITDGKKARKMTIALADLFRYSINYSNNNYTTIKDEVEMAEVYMQIEKIRFEDQLNYTTTVEEEVRHYLVPRFLLQPIVENAVKHGLKATGQMTEIQLEVKKQEDGIALIIADNGSAFPAEITPGYGVKSVFDKLDLLFPGQYEIHFRNEPRKHVSILIHKLMKNEPAV